MVVGFKVMNIPKISMNWTHLPTSIKLRHPVDEVSDSPADKLSVLIRALTLYENAMSEVESFNVIGNEDIWKLVHELTGSVLEKKNDCFTTKIY